MHLLRRLFASDYEPWSPGYQSVSIDIWGNRLSFNCPRPSAWSSSQPILNSFIDKTDSRQFQYDNKFRLSLPGYGQQSIFYREWSHWGRVYRPTYIAATSLCVRIMHVPKKKISDSLHCHFHLDDSFPIFSSENQNAFLSEDEKVITSAGGLLGMPGDDQRTGYSRVCIRQKSQREMLDYTLLSLSCEHAVVFEIYQAQAPNSSSFLEGFLKDQAGQIIDSIRLNLSDEELETKEKVLRRRALETGGEYDEEFGCVLYPLEL